MQTCMSTVHTLMYIMNILTSQFSLKGAYMYVGRMLMTLNVISHVPNQVEQKIKFLVPQTSEESKLNFSLEY